MALACKGLDAESLLTKRWLNSVPGGALIDEEGPSNKSIRSPKCQEEPEQARQQLGVPEGHLESVEPDLVELDDPLGHDGLVDGPLLDSSIW